MSTISIFGLGYVGCVSAACFASAGHRVLGVDVAQSKVDQINAGRSTIVEEGIAELVASAVSSGKLSATTSVSAAVQASEISLVCVGTPSRPNGSIDLAYVLRVAEQIGAALRTKGRFHTVVIRSTVMPGTIDTHVIPAIEAASGLKHGGGFAVCSNPEFLREGTSIRDFHEPPFTLVGALDVRHAEPVLAVYAGVTAPTHVVPLRVAETVKYACNCFHGLKVGFANEIGNLCKVMGVDSHEVMRLFCEDKKLNISTAYLRPGFAFGGSCLPKDLRALIYRMGGLDLKLPLLQSTLSSNRRHLERAIDAVLELPAQRIGVIGLAFKENTDDLRESPVVTLLEQLIGKGRDVRVFDPQIQLERIYGSNRNFVLQSIPHIGRLLRGLDEILGWADRLVLAQKQEEVTMQRIRHSGVPVLAVVDGTSRMAACAGAGSLAAR